MINILVRFGAFQDPLGIGQPPELSKALGLTLIPNMRVMYGIDE